VDNPHITAKEPENGQTGQRPGRFRQLLDRGPLRGRLYLLPPFLLLLFMLIAVWLIPGAHINAEGTSIRTMRAPNFPVALVLELKSGTVASAWLTTPAGAKHIYQIEGMVYVADSTFASRVDQDGDDDLLWRISFTNFDGNGVHLWIGLTTWAPTAYVYTSPYQYTRWDVIPAKLVVPTSTAVYVSPATPDYTKAGQYSGRQSYSFVYTVRLTPEGPAFVPVPDVYRQLAVLLRAGIQGEFDPRKRLPHLRMLAEFNNLAEGKPPQTETLLNFPMDKSYVLTWKK